VYVLFIEGVNLLSVSVPSFSPLMKKLLFISISDLTVYIAEPEKCKMHSLKILFTTKIRN
jgi:hypothetical protein